MRKVDLTILLVGIAAAIAWTVVSGKDGYKGSNAIIVARNIAVMATIEGQIANQPPAAGDRVSAGEVLVRVHNPRMDQSRLVEFRSEIEFLENELDSIRAQQTALKMFHDRYATAAQRY